MSDTLTGQISAPPRTGRPELESLPFELRSLAEARNYQAWIFRKVSPYLGSRIMEVGAGIGNMSRWLPIRERLVLTESDPGLLAMLKTGMADLATIPSKVSIGSFDLARSELQPYIAESLDTIVSFNVLEHVEDDQAALNRLCEILRKSQAKGPRRLVTFVPAHLWAYGAMDKSFGHYRRYSRRAMHRLCRIAAPEARVYSTYVNLIGLAGWFFNGRILRKPNIGVGSIAAFERLCPFVSPVDDVLHKVFRLPLGQSLLNVVEFS